MNGDLLVLNSGSSRIKFGLYDGDDAQLPLLGLGRIESIGGILPEVAGEEIAAGRVIVAHLGNGASLCALRNGRSVDTTMGFTALDGLPMDTRCGNLDPGMVLHLQDELGMSTLEVANLLYHRSGLLGVSGISNDMRELLASDEPSAGDAVNLFVYRINHELGAVGRHYSSDQRTMEPT